MRTVRKVSGLTALIAAVWIVLPPAGMAQLEIPLLEQPSSSPSPSPSPTSSSPTPKPKATSSPKSSTSGGSSGSSTKKSSTSSTKSKTSTVDPVVKKGLELWREREKTRARTTTRLLELIQQAHTGPGDPTLGELRAAFGRFPIVGYTWYQDDYGAPRFSPYYSAHAGNDLFAERGTPVIAVADGFIWKMGSFSRGGNAIWLMGEDKVRYYYGHLDGFAKGLREGARVQQGELIGFVGNTGSAVGTYPHVHFEINPGGLGTVNPKPILDRWLDNAEAAIVARLQPGASGIQVANLGAARWGRLVDLFAEPGGAPPMMWAAGLGGTGGLLAGLESSVWDLIAVADLDVVPAGAVGEEAISFDPLAGLLKAVDGDDHDDHIGF